MAYEKRTEPPEYTRLAQEAKDVYLEYEQIDPSIARAKAMRHVVEHCEVTIERDTVLLGGENPFFFNLMLPALEADRYAREGRHTPDAAATALRDRHVFDGPCFEGHITPGLEYILGQGVEGVRSRLDECLNTRVGSGLLTREQEYFYEAASLSCESMLIYAERYSDEAARLADMPNATPEFSTAADLLKRVPLCRAETLHEAMQSYWIAYVLVTLEMGGCCPGGGLGLGRLDQFLYPYYLDDIREGRLTRDEALELTELFLLAFRHEDYYTGHQLYTPGSQASLGGVTPTGLDASNELTEVILEASLRIAMPAPYLSLRLHSSAPSRYWHVAANYALGGLGFPIVNDEVLIPAMLRHGRSLGDARDYICSCCYENTIPGREAFHPNASYLNLPFVLELALNEGRSLLDGSHLGCASPPASDFDTFESVVDAFMRQLHYVCDRLTTFANRADAAHCKHRRYPLMSLFIDDCLQSAIDVCAGGARYNLSGAIVSGLPNVINSLAAIRETVFREKTLGMVDIVEALRSDFVGADSIRRLLLDTPKWGNGEASVDDLATMLTDAIYEEFSGKTNARGGRWQVALYSFMANVNLGKVVGASADGRHGREALTRNLNPTNGSDSHGPTGILRSLSRIDFTGFPDGTSLDLTFDPTMFESPEMRLKFADFLKAFVDLGVMEMQLSMVSTETLLEAKQDPERFPHLLVRVAGCSARFIDLPEHEQDEIIGRTTQRLSAG